MSQDSVENAVGAETKMTLVTVVVAARGLPEKLVIAREAGAEMTLAEIIGGARLVHIPCNVSPSGAVLLVSVQTIDVSLIERSCTSLPSAYKLCYNVYNFPQPASRPASFCRYENLEQLSESAAYNLSFTGC